MDLDLGELLTIQPPFASSPSHWCPRSPRPPGRLSPWLENTKRGRDRKTGREETRVRQGPGRSCGPVPAGMACAGHWPSSGGAQASGNVSFMARGGCLSQAREVVGSCPGRSGSHWFPLPTFPRRQDLPVPSSWKPKFVKVPTVSSSHISNHFLSSSSQDLGRGVTWSG